MVTLIPLHPPAKRVPWHEIQQLTYTRMVIQETMRLFPPIWALIRIAAADDEIEGHKIKAGDKVVILAGDRSVVLGEVVRVLSLSKEAGATGFALAAD